MHGLYLSGRCLFRALNPEGPISHQAQEAQETNTQVQLKDHSCLSFISEMEQPRVYVWREKQTLELGIKNIISIQFS